MWAITRYLLVYVIGGVTFVPLVIAATIFLVWKYGTTPIGDSDPSKLEKQRLQSQSELDEYLSTTSSSPNSAKPLSGWLTVRRQFKPTKDSSALFSTTTPTTDLTGAEVDDASVKDDISIAESASATSVEAGSSKTGGAQTGSGGGSSTYSQRIAQTYRNVMDAREARKSATPKEYFFVVLKGSVLFLYEDENQTNCVAAIGVSKYDVAIETPQGAFKGKDAEMFAKRNCIVLKIHEPPKVGGLPVLAKGMEGPGATEDDQKEGKKDKDKEKSGDKMDLDEMESAPWYLFSKSNTKMEDWYLALLGASAAKPDTNDVFAKEDMKYLVDSIAAEADPIPMRWLNAMLGRAFFGVAKTAALEQFIINRIMKKLSKVPRPSLLSPIVVREVNVGTTPPFFSKPMLKDLSPEGTAAFEVHMAYHAQASDPAGGVRITVATTASIPTGFKSYNVDLVLAVVLKSIEGNMVLQIKPPPSNRVWYGFTHMPKMEVDIIPIVSDRKISIGMVLRAMEKQLKDVIAESIVLPNMDDIAYFDTSKLDIRGGIFSSAGKNYSPPDEDEDVAQVNGVDVATSAEDPTSAVAETPALRKRRPTKSQSMDPVALLSTEDTSAKVGLPRTDTAPAAVASGPNAKKASAVSATKKWFASSTATTSHHRPTSSLSQLSIRSDGSNESMRRSLSNDKAPASGTGPVISVSMEGESNMLTVDNPATRSASALPDDLSTESLPLKGTNGIADSEENLPRDADRSISPDSATTVGKGASNASLISSIRTRDKKALQSQVNVARDNIKKWGVNFAAKRKSAMHPHLSEERDPDKPAAIYRPETDERDDTPIRGSRPESTSASRTAVSPNRTLKERLNAAAQAATTTGTSSSPGAQTRAARAGSASSSHSIPGRPALATSPKATGVDKMLGVSPPAGWTLGGGLPTTELIRDAASGSTASTPPPRPANGNSHARSATSITSTSTVHTQPSAGRRMVVPRVPRRPGQVTGIGSSNDGMIRRISSDGGDDVVRPVIQHPPPLPRRHDASASSSDHSSTGEKAEPPALPPRRSKETVRDTSNDAIEDSDSSTPVPPPDAMTRSDSAPATTSAPPLPSREPTAEPPPASDTTSETASVAATPAEEPSTATQAPLPPSRGDSHAVTSPQSSLPDAILADEMVPNPHDTVQPEENDPLKYDAGKTAAEEALRRLVQKDDEASKQKDLAAVDKAQEEMREAM